MFPKILLSVLLLIGLLGNLTAAVSSLDIRKDQSVEPEGLFSWGSVCKFADRPNDATFLTMIEQAYKDMKEQSSKNKLPTAMIGLSIGNEVYFSSSVKGQKPIVYKLVSWKGGNGDHNPKLHERFKEVLDALDRCSREGQRQHKNNGMCGEITSTLSWMIDHPYDSPRDYDPKIGAFNANGYFDPCATGMDYWGCAEWTQEMGYRVVQNIENRPDSFPDPTQVDHVALNTCMITQNSGDNGRNSGEAGSSGQ